MTKLELKKKLITIRNGAMITPVLEEIWRELNGTDKDTSDFIKKYKKTFKALANK